MGVQGLLPQLKPIQQPVSLARYKGQTLAIDGYAWLHRSAHSCAMELALGKPTSKYLEFFIRRLNMLRNNFNVQPYLVFDGDSINVKGDVESKRRQKREENLEKGLKLYNSGDKSGSYEFFQKCVDITPEMAKCIIEYCQVQHIPYIVAPFEADAQMVYLEQNGIVDGIISEDSDLLVFGCRKLITKLNDRGECIEICRDELHHLPSRFPLGTLKPDEFRTVVCLSGCDYTSGIPQVGLLTAMKMVLRSKSMEKVLARIRLDGKFQIPAQFATEYELANYAFQFQRVFCPKQQKMVTLNPVPDSLRNETNLYQCIGRAVSISTGEKSFIIDDNDLDHKIHARIARGELNPHQFTKPLVNRERKLRISSQSMPILKKPALAAGKIDSFFSRTTVSVSTGISGPSIASKNEKEVRTQHERKLNGIVERRKLSDSKCNNKNGVSSKFFRASDATAAAAVPASLVATSKLGLRVANAGRSTGPIQETSSSDIEEFQDDISTEIPSSLVSTEVPGSLIPSSLAPTEVDNETSSISEEDSEILDEVDEHAKTRPAKRLESYPQKRHCASLADLRDTYSYGRRAPLSERNINVTSSQPSKAIMPSKLDILSKVQNLSDSPPLRRQATRSVSLSEFVYRGG
ncbi:LAMI_0B03950g1_1 [Lachancea mirantina]|uniref:LAMI_0B03950g1_1 n=1 Tax=Lachancea mirantina TaxID=1230905 RepID=A0A1G4IVP5_9SACH|nr:LAMI_0B03950g1_1 [Lachancea mirantina]